MILPNAATVLSLLLKYLSLESCVFTGIYIDSLSTYRLYYVSGSKMLGFFSASIPIAYTAGYLTSGDLCVAYLNIASESIVHILGISSIPKNSIKSATRNNPNLINLSPDSGYNVLSNILLYKKSTNGNVNSLCVANNAPHTSVNVSCNSSSFSLSLSIIYISSSSTSSSYLYYSLSYLLLSESFSTSINLLLKNTLISS